MRENHPTLRVLYIEDSENDTFLVTDVLRRAGHAVHALRVTTAGAMAAALHDAAWDVILADHTLPSFNAPQALALLQQTGLDIPFIIVSGTMDEVLAVAALRAGAHDFITKGNLARLAPAVERERRDADSRQQRRRAEEALQETLARFQQVWDSTSDALALSDAEGLVLAANAAYCDLYGYPAEQILGHSFALIFPEALRADMVAQYKDIFAADKQPGVYETTVRRADGSERFVEARATFITTDGQRTALLSNIRDITERKRAEAALAASERRFRALVENSADGLFLLDPEGRITYRGPAQQGLTGYTDAERLGHSMLDLVHPDDQAAVNKHLAVLVDQPRIPLGLEYRVRHKDGTWRHFEAVFSNLLDEPSVAGLVVNIRDITGRRQAEANLAASAKRFEALIENSADGISLLGADGRLIYASPSTERILGYSSAELLGGDPAILTHPDDLAGLTTVLKELRQAPGQSTTTTFRFRHKDGNWRWLEATVQNLLDAPGVGAFVSNYRDITERQQTATALQQAEAQYRSLIEQIPAVTYIAALDDTNSTVYISPQVEQFGYTPAEHLADPQLWARSLHPEDASRILSSAAQAITAPGPRASEYRLIDRAGVQHWVRDQSVVVRDADGKGLFLQGVMFNITARKESDERIHRQLQYLTALREINQAIMASFDLRLSLSLLLGHVTERLGVDAAAVFIFHNSSQMLELVIERGFRVKPPAKNQLRLGEGYAGRAAAERRLVHIPNLAAQTDNPRLMKSVDVEAFVGYYAVPLLAKGQVRGVLEIFQRAPQAANTAAELDAEWPHFLEGLAAQAAIAIDNAMLFESLQRSNQDLAQAYEATLEGWSRALELRDKGTEGHSQRVTDLTLRLGQAVGLRDDELVQIRRGALLHDIGKMGIPDSILLKSSPLTDEEQELMRRHPTHAYRLLSPITHLRPALDIPYCHHERWDGTGYPRGLRAEQIPLAARLFAVVDMWDALCSDRPYRAAWQADAALAHIRTLAGTHFDPGAVEAFARLIA